MPDRSERPVTRVTKADGSTVNVRKDELEKFLGDNAGAVAEGAQSPQTQVTEVQADDEAEGDGGTRRAAPKARK